MTPILGEMKKDIAGKLQVELNDVGLKEDLALAEQFGVKLKPVQVFRDSSGKELWRHEGSRSRGVGLDDGPDSLQHAIPGWRGAADMGVSASSNGSSKEVPRAILCCPCDIFR